MSKQKTKVTKKAHKYPGKFNDIKHTDKLSERIRSAQRWNQTLSTKEYQYRKVTWGKYAGYFVSDLPRDYIKWFIMNVNDLEWVQWFDQECHRRDLKQPVSKQPA